MTSKTTKTTDQQPKKSRGDMILTSIIVLIVGFLFAWNIFSYYAPQLKLGGKALTSINGKNPETKKKMTMNIEGQHAVLNFWGTWCSSCIAELPELKEASKTVNVYGVLKAPYRRGSLERLNVSWPHLIVKDSLFVDFHITGVPTTLLIKDGKVDKVVSGPITNSEIQRWLKESSQ
ncbi:TlpA family protein disulfide reductase [bacterium]|nr:TlpA family protein disulfide reductase [bacterium]